jgi:hypothetical protein
MDFVGHEARAMRQGHWVKLFLNRTLGVLGIVAAVILIEIILQGFSGQSHPVAGWAVGKLERMFSPIGRWFVETADWAWISFVLIINIPAAILLTWALHVGGVGIRSKHRPYWLALCWVILVCVQLLVFYWARQSPGL